MGIYNENKLKLLHLAWPPLAVLTTHALNEKGFSNQLIQKYFKTGWLNRISSGAFIRQHEQATWQGGIFAIQHDLKLPIHVGGLTALEMQGLAHYLSLASSHNIYLYNTSAHKCKMPTWFVNFFNKEKEFNFKQCHIFNSELGLTTQTIEKLEIVISSPERAILELLYLVPKYIGVEHAANLVENLQTINPELMQLLLEDCRHILIKRLFLCLADIHQLPVMQHLDLNKIDLGNGDRSVNIGGRYYPKYKIVLQDLGSGNLGEI